MVRRTIEIAAVLAGAVLFAPGALAQSTLLSDKHPVSGSVQRFQVTRDGHRAVYQDQFLHSTSVSGLEPPILLDARPSLASNLENTLAISPDGRWVVHSVFVGGPTPTEFASIPIDGSRPPTQLGGSGFVLVTGDSRTVVMRGSAGLVSVAIDRGSEPIVLQAGPGVGACVLAPDGERVVYVVETPSTPGGGNLVVRSADGSGLPLVLTPSGPLANSSAYRLVFSPAGDQLVFRSGQTVTTGRLFGVPLDGSTIPVQLSAGTAGVDWSSKLRPKIAPDGSVAYKHDVVSPLFAVPVAGGVPPLPLSDALGPGSTLEYELVPDGSRLLFTFSSGANLDLYSVPMDGHEPPSSVTGWTAAGRHVDFLRLDPSGQRVVFVGRSQAGEQTSFWVVPSDGSSAPRRLTFQPLSPTGFWPTFVGSDGFALAQDGDVLVFAPATVVGSTLDRSRFQLFAVPTDGSALPVRIDGPTARGGGVRYVPFVPDGASGGVVFRFAANEKRVLYLADQREPGLVELFGAPLPAPIGSGRPKLVR